MELQGKTVLVTGGGSGIGLGIGLALAEEGCRVALCGRTEGKLRDGAALFKGQPAILTHACDVADRAGVERMFDWVDDQLGGLDILVNSAGYCAAKFAMSAMGTTIGLEERENGIHVTNVYPGEVNTPILADRPTPVGPEKLAQMLMPEDIASVVVTIAKLPARALVPELVITPQYQEYA